MPELGVARVKIADLSGSTEIRRSRAGGRKAVAGNGRGVDEDKSVKDDER